MHHIISAAPSSSCGGLLTLFPAPAGIPSLDTVLYKLLQCESFPQAAGHELLQHGSLPESAVLQEQRGSLWGPKSCQQSCSSMGSSPGVHRPCQEPAPAQASLGATVSFGHIYLLPSGALHRLQVDVCSTTALHGLCLHLGLQGNLCSVVGAPPAPPCAWVLMSTELFLSHLLTPLTGCNCCCKEQHFTLLNSFILEVLPPSLMGPALASRRSILVPAGIKDHQTQGKLIVPHHRSQPCSPLEPWHENPIDSLFANCSGD